VTDSQPDLETPQGIRLQKVLAQAGLGSRRACERLIEEGRVEVDGRTVREQGMRVDPARAVVKVDGQRLAVAPGLVYLALNKPAGVISAMSAPTGRRCVGDLVADRPERLFHVGRLDADTEGLLLLTNDGELAHRLAHPSYEVSKVYLAEVEGRPDRDALRRLRSGVLLDDGTARVDALTVVQQLAHRTQLELTLHEGRNRIVRRLLEAVGHPVVRLVRLQVGPVRLAGLKPGHVRLLRRDEVAALFALTSM
jgi:23S rRNA pseudouridine2605 synthase